LGGTFIVGTSGRPERPYLPRSVSLYAGQQQSIVALVNGSPAGAITWTVSPAIGKISNTGLNTAPTLVPSAEAVTVTGHGHSYATASGKLTPVTISVGPSVASLNVSQTQTFISVITGTTNSTAMWSLNPPVGTLLSTSGGGVVYTAPNVVNTIQTIELDGVSVFDSTKVAKALITLVPVVISMTRTSAVVLPSQTQQFSVNVAGTSNTAVPWSVQPVLGRIDSTGFDTAPATIQTTQNVTVTAQSLADPMQVAQAKVVLSGPPTVTPNSIQLGASQTQKFSYTLGGTATDAYWSISPPVGSIRYGTYAAPSYISAPQTITVTGNLPPYGSATAIITLIPVSISINPTTTTLIASQTQQFTAGLHGTSNMAVTWALSPAVGAISTAGVYTAPPIVPSSQTVAVTATSVADSTQSATVNVSLIPVSVSITPSTASLTQSQTQTFTATVGGSANTAVTWSTPAAGTLVTNGNTGVYASPSTFSTTQTVPITATSMADPTKSTTATISLASAVLISLVPATVSLNAGQTQQFSANVTGTSNTAVTWALSPQVGTIDPTGLYTAPATVSTAQNITVIAQSAGNPTKTATGTISLPATPQLQWSINQKELTSLSYGGVNFYEYNDYIVWTRAFRDPSGNLINTPWAQADSSKLYTNPSAFEQVYNLGKPYQFTVRVTWTQTDSRTLRADALITNNDPVNTLVTLELHILPVNLPGPANQYNQNIPLEVNQFSGVPVTFLSGTWGSVATWQAGYPTQADLLTFYGSSTQTVFDNRLMTTTPSCGPTPCSLEIPPGQSRLMTQYLRFGTTNDTASTLAPEAYSEYRMAFPYLVNWPDRRPIAEWFIAEGTSHTSAINPRGYLWDSTLNVSNTFNFGSKVLAQTSSIIARMNSMTPKPQGIVIWDLEGEEFAQYFTYVGYPNMLPVISPEMDKVADQMFAQFKNAGYLVGMTLRPQTFGAGATFPSACHPSTNVDFQDVFINTAALWPYRGYACSSANTWTQPGAHLPYFQTVLSENNAILQQLSQKVAYAHGRWGARLFYVDSTVYEGGHPIDHSVFRALQQQFPDCLFMPEEKTAYYPGATAPYGEPYLGVYYTPPTWKMIYPQSFSAINAAHADLINHYNDLLTGVKSGDIMLFQAWFDSPEIPVIQQLYANAGQ
jgi:hypothetical protein